MSADTRFTFTRKLLADLVALASPLRRERAGVVAAAVSQQMDVLLEEVRAEAMVATAREWQALVDAKVALVVAQQEAERSLEALAGMSQNTTGCITH